ncbi:hypothetical protein EYS14_03455 [Alteromonadaceae bacterium M269]|nr:hypothetical protein EYS14_03455 [Alteromonadaceae bacterium M269]
MFSTTDLEFFNSKVIQYSYKEIKNPQIGRAGVVVSDFTRLDKGYGHSEDKLIAFFKCAVSVTCTEINESSEQVEVMNCSMDVDLSFVVNGFKYSEHSEKEIDEQFIKFKDSKQGESFFDVSGKQYCIQTLKMYLSQTPFRNIPLNFVESNEAV